jgi:GNAT superfamily N-acetyltransferase
VSTARIRGWRDDDAEAAASLLRAVAPQWLVSPDWLRFYVHSLPERAKHRVWVAEDGGELVGWAEANLRWTTAETGRGEVWVGVARAARGSGLGRALYEPLEGHLGAIVVDTEAVDDNGLRFAERLGFHVVSHDRYSELDPRSALPEIEPPPGIRVVPLAEVLDRRSDLHAVYAEAERDMPGEFARDRLDYDEWSAETLASPMLDPELSQVVLDGDTVVSFAFISADREGRRADNEMTGTLGSHRGRGLARLAKIATIRACRDAGIVRITTSNAETNAPMLAINNRLGYRPTLVTTSLEKRLAPQ